MREGCRKSERNKGTKGKKKVRERNKQVQKKKRASIARGGRVKKHQQLCCDPVSFAYLFIFSLLWGQYVKQSSLKLMRISRKCKHPSTGMSCVNLRHTLLKLPFRTKSLRSAFHKNEKIMDISKNFCNKRFLNTRVHLLVKVG